MDLKIIALHLLLLFVIVNDLKVVNCQTTTASTTDTGTAQNTNNDPQNNQQVDPSSCKNLHYFNTGPTVAGDLDYCKIKYEGQKVNFNRCCDKSTQTKLHEWWYVNPIAQDPEGNTPYILRQKELRGIAQYTLLLLSWEKRIKDHAKFILKGGNADTVCKNYARNVYTREVPIN